MGSAFCNFRARSHLFKLRILVTGASGFIGSYLTPLLVEANLDVVYAVREASQSSLTNSNRGEWVAHNIGADSPGAFFSKQHNIDVIIHLAWDNIEDVNCISHDREILIAHREFLFAGIRSGVKRVFVLGTCYEYGLLTGPVSENVLGEPVTCYGRAKAELLASLQRLKEVEDFELSWGRLFFVYGNGARSNSIYKQLMEAIDSGSEIFEMSLGEQVLDYLHVAEVARLISKIALLPEGCGVVNICSGKPIRLRDHVADWISGRGRSIELKLGAYPYRPHESMNLWGDKTYLQALLSNRYDS